MNEATKRPYANSLLSLATGRHILNGSPLAFGEGNVKGRIKNVMNYKKPGFWMVGIAVILGVVVSVGLIANPMNSTSLVAIEDFSLPLDRVAYGTLISENKHMDFNEAKARKISDYLRELKIGKSPVSKSRDEGRDSTSQIRFVFLGFGNNGDMANVYFNFSKDFSEVWVDNGVKPSLSYGVKKPGKAKDFFERQFGSVTAATEIGSAEELWKARTKYIGDNSSVGKIVAQLQFPNDVTYDYFELDTKDHPYGIRINFKTDTEMQSFYSETSNQSLFQTNALIMFSLIENVEYVAFSFDDGTNQPHYIRYTSDIVKRILGEDYFKESETLENFHALLEKIGDYSGSEKDDNALNFWIKPDEDGWVMGEVAAIQWLNSYKGDDVSETERIKDYTINDVLVMAVDMSTSGDQMYDYIVTINYSIMTATEGYLALADNISGKGTFDGLHRELYVKGLGMGNFQIVDVKKIDSYFDVEGNLDIIMSSPKSSSNPENYIKAHQNEYENFFKYGGEEALQYMLNQFEAGNSKGLRGQIMMRLCKELLGKRNNVTDDSFSPQEWYDALSIHQEIELPNFKYDGQDAIEKLVYDTEIERDSSSNNRGGFIIVAPKVFGSYEEGDMLKIFVTTDSARYTLFGNTLSQEGQHFRVTLKLS